MVKIVAQVYGKMPVTFRATEKMFGNDTNYFRLGYLLPIGFRPCFS